MILQGLRSVDDSLGVTTVKVVLSWVFAPNVASLAVIYSHAL